MNINYEVKFNTTAFTNEDGEQFTISMDGGTVWIKMSKAIVYDLYQALSAEFHSLSLEDEVTKGLPLQ